MTQPRPEMMRDCSRKEAEDKVGSETGNGQIGRTTSDDITARGPRGRHGGRDWLGFGDVLGAPANLA